MSDDTYRPSVPAGANRADYLRRNVMIERDGVANVSSSDFPGVWSGYDDAWNLEKWKKNFSIVVNSMSHLVINFDVIGIDAAIANALRRILIAEIPTIAIETVYVENNTSVMADEVLSHRLGLIPLKVDPVKLDFRHEGDALTDRNTIVFKLNVKCEDNPKAPRDAVHHKQKYINSQGNIMHALRANGTNQKKTALSKHFVWEPQGDQAEWFKDEPVRPVYEDIVITRLGRDQTIDCELHCHKGIGRDHAKFSPVATATYRLLPEIRLLKPITGDQAYKLQSCFSKGVIAVEDVNGVPTASVASARNDTVSREVLRHKEFENDVILTRVRDHFIFEVESVGSVVPAVLIVQSMQILKRKCLYVKRCLETLNATSTEEP
ncbi:DNA-directed RNA polymerase core subunit rpc40 [Sorochytrium milnesiophthora]